jgi:hypothetical protein
MTSGKAAKPAVISTSQGAVQTCLYMVCFKKAWRQHRPPWFAPDHISPYAERTMLPATVESHQRQAPGKHCPWGGTCVSER